MFAVRRSAAIREHFPQRQRTIKTIVATPTIRGAMLARPACQHASATANAKSSCSLEDGSTHPHNSRTSAPASLNPFAIFNCPFSSNTCISLNKSALGTVQHSPGPQMFDCCRTLATGNRLRRNPSPRPHLRRPQLLHHWLPHTRRVDRQITLPLQRSLHHSCIRRPQRSALQIPDLTNPPPSARLINGSAVKSCNFPKSTPI